MDDKTNLIKPILVISIIVLVCTVVILGLQIFQTVNINSLLGGVQTTTLTENQSQAKAEQLVVQQNGTQPTTPSTKTGGLTPLTATQESCLKTCTGSGKTIQVCASATECNLPAK